MSNSGLSQAASIGGRKPPTDKACMVSTRIRVPTNCVSGRMLQPSPEPAIADIYVPSDFLVVGLVSGVGLCTPHLGLLQHMVQCSHVICSTLLETTLCAHRFYFYSFTFSDGSEGTIADRVFSPRYVLVHHGFRSNETKNARKQNIEYAKQHHTLHCWLPANVMYPANATKSFSWLIRSTPI